VATDLSTRSFYQILYKSQTLPIEPNIFRADPATGDMFYIQSVSSDGKSMSNVMIYQPDRSSPFVQILTAKTARIETARSSSTMRCAPRSKPTARSARSTWQRAKCASRCRWADNGQNFLSSAFNDTYTMNTKRLSQDIAFRKQTGQGGTDLAARELTLGSKYAYPFASFIAVIIAVPLAVRFGKNGRMLGIVLSIVLLFIYYGSSRWPGLGATDRSIPTLPRGCRTSLWRRRGILSGRRPVIHSLCGRVRRRRALADAGVAAGRAADDDARHAIALLQHCGDRGPRR